MTRIAMLSLSVVALLVATVPAPAQVRPDVRGRHPRLRAALYELNEARREVEKAPIDFGGRRAKALVAIDDARRSIGTLLNVRGTVVLDAKRDRDFYKRFNNYPRLRQALRDLRDARDELRNARDDFGNRRERALRDINTAIFYVSDMIQYVRT